MNDECVRTDITALPICEYEGKPFVSQLSSTLISRSQLHYYTLSILIQ